MNSLLYPCCQFEVVVSESSHLGEEIRPVMKLSNLKAGGYEKLLELLDPDPSRAELEFQKLRSKLITFFRCRGLQNGEDWADEALLRVAGKLSAGLEIREITNYPYGIARFIALEAFKDRQFEDLDNISVIGQQAKSNPENEVLEKERLEHLRQCFAQLSPAEQEFLSQYDALPNKPQALRKRKSRLVAVLVNCIKRRIQGTQH